MRTDIGAKRSSQPKTTAPHRGNQTFANVRAFTCALFLLLIASFLVFISPTVVSAFSLGKIRVTGAFDKRFKAEIPAITDGNIDMFVSIGGKNDYRRIGVERPAFIDRFIIQITDHPTAPGQKIIYITSQEPIYQPSFNLLIKAQIGGGVILENYFLAVDFAQNLSMTAQSDEERAELKKIAAEMKALKGGILTDINPPEQQEEPTPAPEGDMQAMLDQIRAEEEAAEMGQAQPAPKIKPKPKVKTRVAALPPKPKPAPKIKPKPQPKSSRSLVNQEMQAMLDQIRAEEEAAEMGQAQPAAEMGQAKPAPVAKPAPGIVTSSIPIPISGATFSRDFRVISGDTLYRIAGRLNVSKKERTRVVAAIWLNNKGHFIKGNIHGIRAGASLDMSNVLKKAEEISEKEAKAIISSQWTEWKERSRPSRPVVAKIGAGKSKVAQLTLPAQKIPFRDTVLAQLADWETKNDTRLDLKNVFINKSGTEKIKASVPLAKGASNSGSGQVATFIFEKRNGRYEIVSEKIPGQKPKEKPAPPAKAEPKPKPAPKPKPEKIKDPSTPEQKITPSVAPYVVHVASFKKQKNAEEMVRLLRIKGYNAYEVLTFIPGKGNWYRVVIDRFGSVSKARDFAKSVRRAGVLRYTQILKLPYAVLIDEKSAGGSPVGAVETLSATGVSAYLISNKGKTLILVGAFADRKMAEEVQKKIAKKGFVSRVVKP